MKFGTDTGEYGKIIDSIILLLICHLFSFSSYATLKHLTITYVTLHNLSMLYLHT